MGLFSKIKKAFKKVVKKVAGGIKKVVKKVGKVVKKISKSKLFKAILAVGAIIVTGGAAIGAFGGSLATSGFGSWMVGASQTITGGTLFTGTGAITGKLSTAGNFITKMLAKPFAATGKVLGSAAGALTDVTGFTTKAGRMGYTNIGTEAAPQWVVDKSKQFSPAGKFGEFETSGRYLAEVKGGTDTMFGTGQVVSGTGSVIDMPSGQIFNKTTGQLRNLTDAEIKNLGLDPSKVSINASGQLVDKVTGDVIKTGQAAKASTLTGSKWGDFALNTATGIGTSVATGYAVNKLTQGDPTGEMAGLAYEGKTQLDPLQIYSGGQALSVDGIYQNMLYGTGDPFYQASTELYKQQTIGVPA